jgi:glutamine synthetase
LLAELSKEAGEEAGYLEKDRAYRSEEDVFEDYTADERNRLFGAPPATVWDNLSALDKYTDKREAITSSGAFTDAIIEAFKEGALTRWKTELIARIIPENRDIVRAAKEIKSEYVTDQDAYNWNKINELRYYLAKDSIDEKSLFTLLINALNEGDYEMASGLQVEMYDRIEELKSLYDAYVKNII